MAATNPSSTTVPRLCLSARARREAAWAERRKSLKRTAAVCDEISSSIRRLLAAQGHDAIEAACDQLCAVVDAADAARPLQESLLPPECDQAWQEILGAARALATVAAGGEVHVQPEVDNVTAAFRAFGSLLVRANAPH